VPNWRKKETEVKNARREKIGLLTKCINMLWAGGIKKRHTNTKRKEETNKIPTT
jgi:hypothetical protein